MNYKLEFFSGLIFATAKVAYITAMLIHLFIISSAVQTYEFSYIHYHVSEISVIYQWIFID